MGEDNSSTLESLRVALENGLLGDALDIPSLLRVRAVSKCTRAAHELGRAIAWRRTMQSGELGEAPNPDGFMHDWWPRAVDLGGAEVVTALLEAAGDRARDLLMEDTTVCNNASCLHRAARNGDLEMVDALLRFAGRLGADELRQLLLRPNYYGETCLHVSASRGYLHITQALLAAGGRELAMTTDNSGESCLCAAVRECCRTNTARAGHLEIVRELLRAHPELLMLTTDIGYSCLHLAVAGEHLQVVKCLLQAAGPLRRDLCMITNNQGSSCLHLAVQSSPLDFVVEVLPTLLEAGGLELLTMRDREGCNCLRIAVERRTPLISNMLAEAAGPEGRTELHKLNKKLEKRDEARAARYDEFD